METLILKKVTIEIPYIDMDQSAWSTGFLAAILFALGALIASFYINPILRQTPIQNSDLYFIFIAVIVSFLFGWIVYLIRQAIAWKKFRNNINVLGTRPIITRSRKEIGKFKITTLNMFYPITGDVTSELAHSSKPERPIVAVHHKGKYLLFETI